MRLTFPSRGKAIDIDVALPPGNGRQPAVLVLHGSGGSHDIPALVRELPSHGYVTLVPHYFQCTGTSWADVNSIQQHGVTWGKTVLDAVEYAMGLPRVDPEAVGIIGFSLGGYLAIAVASHDRRMKCVVEFFGGAPEKFLPSINHLPPTLILHGEDDQIVPVRHAKRLQQLCEEKSFSFEIEIYPGAGHSFTGALMQTAMKRAMAFLNQQLKVQSSSQCLRGVTADSRV
jgi:dienelactone hydrolase